MFEKIKKTVELWLVGVTTCGTAVLFHLKNPKLFLLLFLLSLVILVTEIIDIIRNNNNEEGRKE